MTRSRLPLVVGLSVVMSMPALGEISGETGVPVAEADQLSEHFRQFVDDAIDEGLLAPAGSNPQATPVFRGRLDSAEPSRPVPMSTGCTAETELDFAPYISLSSYEDFLHWRAQKLSDQESIHPIEMAMAYITIGLFAEARLQLADLEGQNAELLRDFSHFLEEGRVTRIDALNQAAECNPSAAIWQSLAKVTMLDPDGVSQLNASLTLYRKLPWYLKIRFAAMAVPALDQMGEPLLAEKMMADFTAEQIARSPRLSLNQAILDMYKGGLVADEGLRPFLRNSDLRSVAAAALLKHGFPIETEVQNEVVGNIVENVQRMPDGQNIRTNLRAMLDRPAEITDYETISRLASLPTLQEPETRQLLSAQLVRRLEADFSKDDHFFKVAAMSATFLNRDLLGESEEAAEVLKSATVVAADLGLVNVVNEFANDIKQDDDLASKRAEMAFRMFDVTALRNLSGTDPNNTDVTRLAAMSAIMARDTMWLQTLVSKVSLDAATLVDLIECDAVYGDWVLPENFYVAAEQIADEQYIARAQAVLALRARGSATGSRKIHLNEIPENLQLISQLLDSTIGGAL